MQTSTRAPLTEHVSVPSANTNIQRPQAGKYYLLYTTSGNWLCLFLVFVKSSGDL